MLFLRSFFRRITDDLKLKKLVPLKILFFVHASTLFVLYPYLTIHMRELGINVEEAAIMSAVTPVVSIVMPPLAGMLADKIGNFRLLLALSSVLGGASALLLLLVPVGRLTLTFPRDLELLAACSAGNLQLTSLQEHPCLPAHPYASDINISIQSCGFVCDLPQDLTDAETSDVLRTKHYAVSLHSPVAKESAVYRYTVSASSVSSEDRRHQTTTRIMTNDLNYKSTVRKVSDEQLFFPSTELYQMDCIVDDSMNASCSFQKEGSILEVEPPPALLSVFRARVSHEVGALGADVRRYRIQAIHKLDNDTSDDPDYDGIDSVLCRDGFAQEDSRADGGRGAAVVSVWSGGRRLSRCRAGCVATASRAALCDNPSQLIEIDPAFTFWTYLAVRVFIGIIGGTAFAMFEGAVIAILREQQADYGLQRIYGSIGGMISSPLSGLLIDYASRGKGYTDFRPAFYLYAGLKIMSGALMMSIDLQFKQPAQNLMEDVLTVFCNIEIVALFMACFIMGTAWGYIESFLFWLLQDMGASQSLMGVTITVGGIAGLPLLVMSGPIIRRLGHANVLFIGFVFYAIRLLGYSLIYNPWLCLVFESLESVTSSLSFTAAVTYAARLSSSTTDTSVQGLLGGIYYGVGKGSGSLIGGYLMKFIGTRPTYQVFAAFTLLTGCIYFLFNKFYLRKRPQREANDIYKKKPKVLDVECRETAKEKVLCANLYIEGAIVVDEEKSTETNPQVENAKRDNTDGGSDSGVDNLAYTDGETPPVLTQAAAAALPPADGHADAIKLNHDNN